MTLKMNQGALVAALREFAKPGSTAKERDFTPLTKKLNTARTDLLTTPYAADPIMIAIDKTISVVQAAKKSVRPMHLYQRASRRPIWKLCPLI